jgi:hypothetical protein
MYEVDLSSQLYEISGHQYTIVTGKITGGVSVLAVTDEENGIHYESEEVDAFYEDRLSTATVPDGNGVPDKVVSGVSMEYMEEITAALRKADEHQLNSSLRMLGRKVLGPDANRKMPESESSRTARRRMKILNHESSPSDYLKE